MVYTSFENLQSWPNHELLVCWQPDFYFLWRRAVDQLSLNVENGELWIQAREWAGAWDHLFRCVINPSRARRGERWKQGIGRMKRYLWREARWADGYIDSRCHMCMPIIQLHYLWIDCWNWACQENLGMVNVGLVDRSMEATLFIPASSLQTILSARPPPSCPVTSSSLLNRIIPVAHLAAVLINSYRCILHPWQVTTNQ